MIYAAVRRYGALAVLLVLSIACADAALPTAPTATSSTPTPSPSNAYWTLTTTLTDVTGRHVCPHWPFEIGKSVGWLLDVKRSGNAVTLVYDVRNIPTDHLELVGTLSGNNFEASSAYPGYQPCGGVRFDYDFESRVAGQFSADGNRITARETWSYRAASGDAFVFHFDWSARAPQ
jgi:hypothetical protein